MLPSEEKQTEVYHLVTSKATGHELLYIHGLGRAILCWLQVNVPPWALSFSLSNIFDKLNLAEITTTFFYFQAQSEK